MQIMIFCCQERAPQAAVHPLPEGGDLLILLILLILAAAVLLIALGIYIFVFYSPNGSQNNDLHIARTEQMDALREEITGMIVSLNALPYEAVSTRSDDGLTLRGRYYHSADGAPVVIGFHGYRGTPSRDFSGGAQFYIHTGYNLLLIEERAHCGSGGHTITFGVRERYDCLRWIDYVRERFGRDCPTVIAGISMGASTVLMASGLALPNNVVGVLADSPYTSPKEIILKVSGDLGIPAGLVSPFAALGARLYGGFRLTDADASEAVRHSSVPILLIHGEDDRFVPCRMGRMIAEANPDMIEFHTFPNAGHGLSYLVDRERYEAIVCSFLGRVFALARSPK